jgi:hypothetical protein
MPGEPASGHAAAVSGRAERSPREPGRGAVTRLPHGLVLTFAAVSIVTISLALLWTLPVTALNPLRRGVLEFDEPTSSPHP